MSEYIRGPIPPHLWDEFIGFMGAADNDDLPDGAWFAVLEDSAQTFMGIHKLRGCNNSAAFQYLNANNTEN